MTEETITILKVGTEDAVKSVNDLKENIKLLKQNLGELEIGTDTYQNTLEELKINQNALKDAMYATTTSMEDVAAAATGASKSYNSLVHQMAALKEEWRATNDEARRNQLGVQIAEINQQLKDMDASVGNFQRNVGNYESGVAGIAAKFDAWGATLKQMPPTLGAAKESIGKVGESMQLVGKQPILGIIGLLAPIIMKITASLQENQTAMDAVKKLMESLQPVFDVLSGVLEGIAQGLSKAVEWLVQFVGESDGVKKVVSSIIGVGNSIFQYLLAPIKSAVAAFKGLGKIIGDVFKGDWSEIKNHAKETGQEIADAYKEGFSFKTNFETGKAAGTDFINGVKDNKESAKQAGKEVASSFKEGYDEVLEQIKAENAELAEIEAAQREEDAFNAELQAEMEAQEAYDQWQSDRLNQQLTDRLNAKDEAAQKEADLEKAVADEVTAYLAEQDKKRKESAEETAQARIDTMFALADATSSILGSIADMYEADEENAEKNAKKIKALRIAEATINTISGAIGAYMSAVSTLPAPYGIIVGAAQAATVTAAGLAQIAQMRKTKVSSSGGASAAPSAIVSAPTVETNLPSVRSVTSATEEERLNQMAKDQRVYILSSDIEASLDDNKTRVEESSF